MGLIKPVNYVFKTYDEKISQTDSLLIPTPGVGYQSPIFIKVQLKVEGKMAEKTVKQI